MKQHEPKLHIALPAMNERDFIEKTLDCIKRQNLRDFHTWICVNQPESYHTNPEKKHICQNNARTLELLNNYDLVNLHLLDYTSQGRGWQEGKLGVGMARKTLMDAIAADASPADIIVSMDADTIFETEYLASVKKQFDENPGALALANPYYHPMVSDEPTSRAMLRYEIYMRYYALNMRFTGTPYCFSPLGSAMAARVSAYRKINGLTPKKSGEDFYFLQKMVKAGHVLMYNDQVIYPGTRLSDRVFFGTGPAMIKGIAGQWSAYPLFNPELFDKVKQTLDLFPTLFHHPCPTPMDGFFESQFREPDIFEPLRKNHKDPHRFIKACHEKIDGLRILQFLKAEHALNPRNDEDNLAAFLEKHFPDAEIHSELKEVSFLNSDMDKLNKIRNFLFYTELKIQRDEAHKNRTPL
ncbi:MAG: glycosyltransferase [Bacteroidetes bacterium]|nr:MAG: glycosyltransferase [Bacteroidota bacterium]